MTEIQTASRDQLADLIALFSSANGSPYPPAPVAEEKLFGSGVTSEPVVRVATVDGSVAGVAVTSSNFLRLLAVDPAHRRRGIGSALLRDSEESLRSRGQTSCVVGAEPGNYFTPGVAESDRDTNLFFTRQGYSVTSKTVNLRIELTDNALVVDPCQFAGSPIRRARHDEKDALLGFIREEFGRAWECETSRAFEAPAPTVFLASDDHRYVGFSAHDCNNRGLGFFGPEGVARGGRKKGFGKLLLLASLADLQRLGYTRTIISWAAAIPFYAKTAAADIDERFNIFRKALTAGSSF